MTNSEKMTYVYDGREFHLTGRIATSQHSTRNITMVEIHPVHEAADSATYDKWVKMSELLLIRNTNNED